MAETKKTVNEEKLVKIRIPRLRQDDPDVYVSVNNRDWLIKRGAEVEVPESVVEVLRHQEESMEAAYTFAESVKD